MSEKAKMANKFELKIEQSPTSNDHQVRIFIDDVDFLGENQLGIDPPYFFKQNSLFSGGQTIVGRCGCGCLGCGDLFTNIIFQDHFVIWQFSKELSFNFEKNCYLEMLDTKKNDYSWENVDRTVERLLTPIFEDLVFNSRFSFDWVSARCNHKQIILSYSFEGQQSGLCFDWDGITPEDALSRSEIFIQRTKSLEKKK